MILLLALLSFAVRESPAEDACMSPDKVSGICKKIHACPSLLDLLRNSSLPEEVVRYLKRSQCGFSEGTPTVCCTGKTPQFENKKSTLLPDHTVCGRHPEDRLIGGKQPMLDQYPWTVLLRSSKTKEFNCGGSLISDRYVLTSAHCVVEKPETVRLGEYQLNTTQDCADIAGDTYCNDLPSDVGVEEVIVHEEFSANDSQRKNDIALIRLKNDIAYSDSIKPVCLPKLSEEPERNHRGRKYQVAGWGAYNKVPLNTIKHQGNILVEENSICEKALNITLTNRQLCGENEQHNFGSLWCSEDSGGALLSHTLENGFNLYVAGILSSEVSSCGQEKKVYTKVAPYVKWIVGNLRP